MRGPYWLDKDLISQLLTRTSPGAYLLGHHHNQRFKVKYVGRSDTKLDLRLKKWADGVKYRWFKYEYFKLAKDAFRKECNLWHQHGGEVGKLDNEVHPRRTGNTYWKCPKCSKF